MKYKATTHHTYTSYGGVQEIKGGHSEEFESDYQIQPKHYVNFTKLFGNYHVVSVEINLKTNIIELLCAPKI